MMIQIVWRLFNSWFIQYFSWSKVQCRLGFLFMMHQAGTHSLLSLQSHAVVACAEWGLALSCWNKQDFLKKVVALIAACQWHPHTNAVSTGTPPYHNRCCFALFTDNSLGGPVSSSTAIASHWIYLKHSVPKSSA